MIVHDGHCVWPIRGPDEADTILLVDPDAVLARTVAFELFEAIRRWYAEIVQHVGLVKLIELATGNGPQSSRAGPRSGFGVRTVEHIAGALSSVAPDHMLV
jgi:hypothetical protein